MMKLFITILTLCAGIAINADAQTFTQRVQQTTAGGGTVTIHQDKEIEDLVNGTHSSAKPTKTITKPTTKPATKPAATTKTATAATKTTSASNGTQNEVGNNSATPSADTVAAPKHYHKAIGYRIQVFAGGNTRSDRQKAEKTGNALKQLFPGEEVYVHFYSPRWICRMGNYRNYEDAKAKVEEVRKLGYESATIVKGKISVAD